MSKPLRAVQLTQMAMEHLRADIEAGDAVIIGQIIAETLARLSLRRDRAWAEVARIADLDPRKESARLSMLTNEILVYAKESPHEDDRQ